MGTIFSSPDDPNPNTTAATTTSAATTATTTSAAMSQTPSENLTNPDQENTSQPPKTLETPETLNPNHESENPNQESSKPVQDNDNPDQELEEEEEGECPFCAYMKGGECRETFINWEKCIEEAENNGEDIVNKCVEVTTALKKCMEANQDYYAPILQAEKSAEQQVLNQLEQEKAKEAENAKVASETSSGEDEEKVKQETS
ncbi:GCK-like protein [Tanacetum coccineum]